MQTLATTLAALNTHSRIVCESCSRVSRFDVIYDRAGDPVTVACRCRCRVTSYFHLEQQEGLDRLAVCLRK